MKISVVINNYNYAQFVTEALESVLEQTYAAHEIVVVDDGSTDNSLEVLNEFASRNEFCKVIGQKNQGQLQAMITGCEAATGDVLCFMDADDRFRKDHLDLVRQSFEKEPRLGMRFCTVQKFGAEDSTFDLVPYFGNLGVTAILTYMTADFLGNVTSSLSISSRLRDEMVPHLGKHASRWRTRADNCFIWGASLAGALKENVNVPSVLYRIHDTNLFAGIAEDCIQKMNYLASREYFIVRFAEDIGFIPQQVKWVTREYRTCSIDQPGWGKRYRKAVKSHRNPFSALGILRLRWKMYFEVKAHIRRLRKAAQ